MTITSSAADMQLFGKREFYELHKYTQIYARAQVNSCATSYSLVLQELNNHLIAVPIPNPSFREVELCHFTVGNKFFV